MKLSVAREKLSHLLFLTSSIVERRNTMPILANVKLNAQDGKLVISATDLEVSLLGETEAEVTTPGAVTVAAKVIYEIVKELEGETVSISVQNGQRIELESAKSNFKINGISADEFPNISGTVLTNPISVDAEKLAEMLDKTVYAVSVDETRYNINGVCVETIDSELGGDNRTLRFVATDGNRLALVDRPAEGFSELPEPVIIPRKGIYELKKVLDGNDGAANVGFSEGFFTVHSGDVTLGIRLVDGTFPDYRQVLRSDAKTKFTVERSIFHAAIRRVALVTTDRAKTLKFDLSGEALIISSSSPEYGEAREVVDVQHEGDDVKIGFSARYLLDALGTMSDSKEVTVNLDGNIGPCEFIGSEDENYRAVVMPMRF